MWPIPPEKTGVRVALPPKVMTFAELWNELMTGIARTGMDRVEEAESPAALFTIQVAAIEPGLPGVKVTEFPAEELSITPPLRLHW